MIDIRGSFVKYQLAKDKERMCSLYRKCLASVTHFHGIDSGVH